MHFRPCIIIPIYNHHATIKSTVEKLLRYQYPILIVDDGSNGTTKSTLSELAATASVQIFNLPYNQGKGAAVMHGLSQAHALGFTHGLQIDADGQHNTNDVPRFMDAGKQYPNNVICGKPVYDHSVPKKRLYGRYITHFFVWLETLSFNIKDSMCGFRLYPLEETQRLIRKKNLPKRMDFDTAIAVHLSWAGVKFINLDTHVTYPEDGISHFDMWHDNVRITKMHTKLCIGMLVRLPLLLARKILPRKTAFTHWSQLSERGSTLGMSILTRCYQYFGKPLATALLYPIVFYFFMTGKPARLASSQYLALLYQHSQQRTPAPSMINTFWHMLSFARSGLDKLSAWMDDAPPANVRIHGIENIATGQPSTGALIIGAHLGNIEMARALANQQNVIVNAVVYTEHAQKFNHLLENSNQRFGVNLLQVSQFGPDTAVMLKEKIDQGEMVVIVGDRTPVSENGRVSSAHFLGKPAKFAQGPWILASLLECPVLLMFCLPKDNGHDIFIEPFANQITLQRNNRNTQLAALIQRYADRLADYCQQYPYQWFNFYNFWK